MDNGKWMAGGGQGGVALITALLITALVTVAAVAMASRQQLDIRRTGNLMEADQAWEYALALEIFARQVLAEDDPARDTLDPLRDPWAMPALSEEVEGGTVMGSLEDMQGRFNLNNLVDREGKPVPAQEKLFTNLLALLAASDPGLKINPFLTDVVVDWMDRDPGVYRNGAEDGDYLGLAPPYRTGRRPLASPSELMAMMGFDARTQAAVSPFVTALPSEGGVTRINVNTAPEMVLMMLDRGIDPGMAKEIVARRKKTPFDRPEDFVKYMKDSFEITIEQDLVGVNSEYFLVSGLASVGRTDVQLYSLLKRNAQDRTITTLSRSIGVY